MSDPLFTAVEYFNVEVFSAILRAWMSEFQNLFTPHYIHLTEAPEDREIPDQRYRDLPSESRGHAGGGENWVEGARLQCKIRILEEGTGARRTAPLTRAYRCVYCMCIRLPHALWRSCGSWDLGLKCGSFE